MNRLSRMLPCLGRRADTSSNGVLGSDSAGHQRGESNMLPRPWAGAALLWLLAALPVASQSKLVTNTPHLERRGDTTQLIVDGKPFLVLGGELYNNSATSLEYMKPVWPRLAAMHLNTVLAPVSWALLEPSEGKFEIGRAHV